MGKSLKKALSHPSVLLSNIWQLLSPCIKSDKVYLAVEYLLRMGKMPSLKRPRKFSEKLLWLKLHDRRPEYTVMVDKRSVKEYVANIIGDEYIIPTLGVWSDFDDIDFESLPDRFVLKVTHDSGGLAICRDKSKFDYKKAKQIIDKSLKRNFYRIHREFPYRDVKRLIIAEAFVDENGNYSSAGAPSPMSEDLTDYKFYCFAGVPKYCQVIKDRSTKETIDFFDDNWVHQSFVGLNPYVKNADIEPAKPHDYDKMLDIARTLSRGIPFCRIDLYNLKGKIYFGEITFFPSGGHGRFNPPEWDEKLGELIDVALN